MSHRYFALAQNVRSGCHVSRADIATFPEDGCHDLGMVVRDETGVVLQFVMQKEAGCATAREEEMRGLRSSMEWIQSMG
ncbi:hypothetical protein LINPERHAP1_LOCUS14260, partial [Linum perenne]